MALAALGVGCDTGDRYDGKLVKDADGQVYRLRHNLGDTYFIEAMNTNDLERLRR